MTGELPAVPLSRLFVRNNETGNFASPSRGGFALFGGRRLCQKIDRKPHNLTIGSFREKLDACW